MCSPVDSDNSTKTGVDLLLLKKIGIASVTTPNDIIPHPRITKYHIENRIKKIEMGTNIDWATAEALAFGSLLFDGFHVRISGQDVGRGTFSQRHAMLVDNDTERTVIPLNRMSYSTSDTKHGSLEIANSHLSEFAVLGFEYGMSWESPRRLCIWEAQFGDFFNGAQIVIDVYLASGESKWMRQSGLVMLLPHGYDGAGPEHSSCRVERFLQLCDEKFGNFAEGDVTNPNMHVVNPSTPAQYFHILRRQMMRNYRKPLIIVGPKALLRHPVCTSSLDEMSTGSSFLKVLVDDIFIGRDCANVEYVCFVSGKIYYDLYKHREHLQVSNICFIRCEELNPFPASAIKSEASRFRNVKKFYWVQEEPQNQGAYTFMSPRLESLLGVKIQYHGRAPLPAPATGISSRYKNEQKNVIEGIFDLTCVQKVN